MKNRCTGKLLVIAIAAIAFSCSNEKVVEAPTDNNDLALSFSTYIGNPTLRASTTDLGILKDNRGGFNVIAWKTDEDDWSATSHEASPDFMPIGTGGTGVSVLWDNPVTGAWNYSPTKYWPGKYDGTHYGKVTFFGFSSALGTSIVSNLAASAIASPSFTVTIPNGVDDQKDVIADMLADRTYANTNSGNVKFQFDHILSKIGFSAKLAAVYTDATVTVTDLTIVYTANAIKNEGTYTFATNNTQTSNWTSLTGSMSGDGYILTSGSITLDNTASLTPSNLSGTDKFLMLLPQTTAKGNLTAQLTYTVKTGSDPGIKYYIEAPLPGVTWLPGKEYTYTFNLTLNPVIFDVSTDVNVWANATNQPATTDVK
ncbi:MAG: fimbrillin family protein [Tannerellaceae bacterium]|jgi:hypothetical protein|nr:fimbrillin family protein [Tannerellaceae bacterium]